MSDEYFLQDALVQQVASVNKNTIIVVNSVGPILVEQWIDHPNGKYFHNTRFHVEFIYTLMKPSDGTGLERLAWTGGR